MRACARAHCAHTYIKFVGIIDDLRRSLHDSDMTVIAMHEEAQHFPALEQSSIEMRRKLSELKLQGREKDSQDSSQLAAAQKVSQEIIAIAKRKN